jgi:hypothetical protein
MPVANLYTITLFSAKDIDGGGSLGGLSDELECDSDGLCECSGVTYTPETSRSLAIVEIQQSGHFTHVYVGARGCSGGL